MCRKNGAFVQTPQGYGNVTQINLLRQKIKVRLDGADQSIKTFDPCDVAAVPGGRPRPGEPLPVVLKPKAEPAPEPAVGDSAAESSTGTVPAAESVSRTPEPPAVRESAPKAEESRDGASKPQQQRRRSRSRKPKPTPEAGAAPKNEGQQKQTGGEERERRPRPKKPPQEKKPQNPPQEKKPQADGTAPAKKNEGRRRYYHRRPKGSGSGSGKSE